MRFFFALICLCLTSPAHARWADEKEAGYSLNFENVRYRIDGSARYTVEVEREVSILKDSERTNMGLFRTVYDAHASDFDLLEAYTKNGDKTLRVLPQHVEIKPLASSGPGFDEQRQVTIGFREVNVGSRVYVRYRREVRKAPIPGLFAVEYPLGWGELVRGGEISFDSELPLFFELNDPDHYLEAQQEQKGKRYLLTIRLKKPVYRTVLEEEDTLMSPRALPWLAVSTVERWADFPAATPLAYENIIRAGELPALFAPIYEKAKKEEGAIAQINSVTSSLAALVRYVGDWAPVEGLNHPRSLQTVADTGFGDCKDFTTVTATILRKLGFETHAAWVNRGKGWVISPISLPTSAYNHAIVYAKKDGKEYWIDPTNTTSFAQGIDPDIANRPALILEPGQVRRSRTPEMTAEGAEVAVEAHLRFNQTKKIVIDGSFSLRGRSTINMTGSGLGFEKSRIEYSLAQWLTDTSNLLSWKFDDIDLTSRVVRDFKSNFRFEKRWNPVITSAGRGYLIGVPPTIDSLQFRRDQRVSDLFLQDPSRWRRHTFFHGKEAVLNGRPSCRVTSEWINFSRKFEPVKGGLALREEVETKVSIIPLAEIQTDKFAKLQEQIADCVTPAVVVFR